MTRCRECDKELIQNTSRQQFCNDYCRGAYHRLQLSTAGGRGSGRATRDFELAVMAGGLRSNERTQER